MAADGVEDQVPRLEDPFPKLLVLNDARDVFGVHPSMVLQVTRVGIMKRLRVQQNR